MTTTSTTLRRASALGGRFRRGVQMIEFAILLPFFLVFILFALNMGVVVLQHAALQAATHDAARAGAQVGGGGVNDVSRLTFSEAMTNVPGMEGGAHSAQVTTGSRCSRIGPNRHVTVEGTYDTPLVTPGFASLIGMMSGDSGGPEGTWRLRARSVARCEVVRS